MKFASRAIRSAVADSLFLASAAASAAPVTIDASPTGSFYNTWANQAPSQNFLVQFTLAETTDLTGFDLFTLSQFATTGAAVTVRIRSDVAGNPAGTNLFQFDDAIDSVTGFDAQNVVAAIGFGGVSLAAGSYWIGVSGASGELGWSSYNNGTGVITPADQRQLSGNNVTLTPTIYDLAYRIHGETAFAVPEPATALLVGLALAGLGVAGRRRGA